MDALLVTSRLPQSCPKVKREASEPDEASQSISCRGLILVLLCHCQIISVSAVFYPLPPSIIAFSRRNLWLSVALLAVYLQYLISHP